MKILTLLTSALAAAALSGRADIIYDTLDQTVTGGGAYTINYWYWQALAFVPDTNYHVTSVQIYVSSVGPQSNSVFNIELRGDAGGQPGSILCSVPMAFPGWSKALVTATFPGTAVSGGTSYWLTLRADDDYGGGWYFANFSSSSSFSIFRVSSDQGSTWWPTATYAVPLPTARISGSAVQPPPGPSLSIFSTTTNTFTVSWPSPSTGWNLQQNTNSVSSVNWSNVTSGIQDDGTTKTLIVNPPTGHRFYRLRKP